MAGLVLTINIMQGTTLAQACVELCLEATRQRLLCRADFNGLLLVAGWDDDPVQLVTAAVNAIATGQVAVCVNERLSHRLLAEASVAYTFAMAIAKPAEGSA